MNPEKESTTFCRGLSFFLSLLTQQEMYLNVTLLKKEFYAWWNDLAKSIFGMEKLKCNLFSFFISCNLIFPQWMPSLVYAYIYQHHERKNKNKHGLFRQALSTTFLKSATLFTKNGTLKAPHPQNQVLTKPFKDPPFKTLLKLALH